MTKKKSFLKIPISIYENENELAETEKKLLIEAQKACDLSYSPYSNFCVGSAVLLKNKQIVLGANQENVAYPSGLCAERVAFFNCGVQFPNEEILMIAAVARKANTDVFVAASPCGACRQVMVEFENKQAKPIAIIFKGESEKIYIFESVSDLLPIQFKF